VSARGGKAFVMNAPQSPCRSAACATRSVALSVAAGERGSAYVIALLVLVVLTIIGLALTLITQTEVQIGANEASQNRSFYAADSWNGLVYPFMARNYNKNVTFNLNTTQYKDAAGNLATATFADEVTVTPLTSVNVQPCNVCDIADPNSNFKQVTNVLNSTSNHTGFATIGGTQQQVPFSQKTISVFIVLQPWAADPLVFQNQSQAVSHDILLMKF
jgi:hypothetical protein